jgi:coronin-1B/1C/6
LPIADVSSSDGNIRYFEYENDKFQYLTEYKSVEPQRGIAFLPKRGVNVSLVRFPVIVRSDR